MGILRWLKKSKPDEETTASGPHMPAVGTIIAFDAADGVGQILLDDGTNLRLGRTGCKGFEPVVGVLVNVQEVKPRRRGGFNATQVVLDASQNLDEYDAKLADRDKQLGILQEVQSPLDQAVATASTLGWVVILLDRHLPTSSSEFKAFAKDLNLEETGVVVERDPQNGALHFQVGNRSILTQGWANEPYPEGHMDLRNVPEHFNIGCAFAGFGVGLPGMSRIHREITAGNIDAWAEGGPLRDLSRLLTALLPYGTGVVLPRSGEVVIPSEHFVELLGNLDDPQCRPFCAWIDYAFAEETSLCLRTYGMGISGFLDVSVPIVDRNDAWEVARAREAMLFTCHQMVHLNREFDDDETIEVVVGASIGAYPLELTGDTIPYSVHITDDMLWLRPRPTLGLDEKLRLGNIAPNGYEALFWHSFAKLHASFEVAQLDSDESSPVPHTMYVREPEEGDAFFIVTIGIGRVVQPGSSPEYSNERVELISWCDQHSPDLASFLSLMGSLMHDHDDSEESAWKAGDTVTLPEGDDYNGIRYFVLADAGSVALRGGMVISLLAPIPLTRQEYEGTRRGRAAQWLEDNMGDDVSAAPVRARWCLGMHDR